MQRVEVLLAGLGGQGVQLAGDILAQSCTLEGKQVSVLPSYGAEARGTLIRAEVVISDQEIVYPGVLEPDLFVAFSQEAYDHFLPMCQPETRIIYDPASVAPAGADASSAKRYAIPAIEGATELGNAKAANMVMLGALAAFSDLVSKRALHNVLDKGVKERRERNVRALEKGFDLASQLVEL